MPLAHRVGIPAARVGHLRDHPVLERNPTRESWEPRRGLGDAGHVVRCRIAPVEQARARRRAQRGGVEVGVAHAAVGDSAHRRGFDRPAERFQRAVADVIPDDHQHVGSAGGCGRRQERPPVRLGIADIGRHSPRPLRHFASPPVQKSRQQQLRSVGTLGGQVDDSGFWRPRRTTTPDGCITASAGPHRRP